MNFKSSKIVYCIPALYSSGGVERVVSVKASFFAEQYGYDVTIIVTEGKDKTPYFPLSEQVKVINLGLDFEELWHQPFVRKVFLYLKKQRAYKKRLTAELMSLREINFITKIKDGSKKIGELHVNRANYRNFEANETNIIKQLFAKFWMRNLIGHLKELDQFVVLTESERLAWPELSNVCVIADPLSFQRNECSPLTSKRVISIGRYAYQKGIDFLLKAWAKMEKDYPDWELAYYGQGDREPFIQQAKDLNLDLNRCHLNEKTTNVQQEMLNSSVFVLSSRFEGFGMVLIEAMACGVPVVSFDCKSGPSEIISDGKDGYLVPDGDVDALAEKVSVLISHQELRAQLGKKAYEQSSKYDVAGIANLWVRLFDELMAKQ